MKMNLIMLWHGRYGNAMRSWHGRNQDVGMEFVRTGCTQAWTHSLRGRECSRLGCARQERDSVAVLVV